MLLFLVIGAEMEKIESNLAKALKDAPGDAVAVLITVMGDHANVLAVLETMGVTSRRDLLPLGILVAPLTAKQVNALAAHPDVESLALDEDASIQ